MTMTPSLREALARLRVEDTVDGSCFVISLARGPNGDMAFTTSRAGSGSLAIQKAGDMSTHEIGVLVVAFSEGAPLVLARYGEVPIDELTS